MANFIQLLDKLYVAFLTIFDKYTSNIVIALLILFIGSILARLVDRILRKILEEFEVNNILKKATNISLDIEVFIAHTITAIIYIITIILVTNQLGLTTALIKIIIGAILIVAAASAILALKDFIPNALAGLKIRRKNIIKVKDKIKLQNVQGTIKEITLLETKVLTKNKDMIHIPNILIVKH